jgi:hypothetical protein
MKPFSNHTDRLRFTTVESILIPKCESLKPSFLYIRKMGTAAAMGGNMLVDRTKNRRSSFRGIRNREKAYAVMVPKNTEKKVAPKPIMTELTNR